jgi:hypothetical protein
MLLLMWRYSWISSLFMCLALSAFAQKEKAADSTRGFQRPTGIRLGTDLISLGKTFANSSFSGWEGNADVDFGRYYAALDYGFWKRDLPITNGTYQNDGRYLRVGMDINFLLKDPDKNMFFIGFRYARSNFNEQVEYQTSPIEFGDFQMESSNLGAKAGWVELTSGLRVKVWNQFWLGFTGRMKFLPHVNGNPLFETYEIPGFGQTFKGIYWGFNYQAFWRIPFKNSK